MSTLQQQRQAIAAGMAASRAPTGQSQRQAGGQAMVERRTGTTVADDINRLTEPRPPRRTLSSIEPVGALPPSRGRGVYKPPPATGGGGIASPLIEDPANPRTYYDSSYLSSTDGLILMEFKPTKTMHMLDANGEPVAFEFAEVAIWE